MGNYAAKTTSVPPSSGSKQIYSPDLFDSNTGDYPISPIPATVHYNLPYVFFDGLTLNGMTVFWPQDDYGTDNGTHGSGSAAYSTADKAITSGNVYGNSNAAASALGSATGAFNIAVTAPTPLGDLNDSTLLTNTKLHSYYFSGCSADHTARLVSVLIGAELSPTSKGTFIHVANTVSPPNPVYDFFATATGTGSASEVVIEWSVDGSTWNRVIDATASAPLRQYGQGIDTTNHAAGVTIIDPSGGAYNGTVTVTTRYDKKVWAVDIGSYDPNKVIIRITGIARTQNVNAGPAYGSSDIIHIPQESSCAADIYAVCILA